MSDSQSDQNPKGKWSEWRRNDPISKAMGGLVLILLGVVFFITQNGMFGVSWENMWGVFLMGLGGLLILQGLLRLVFSGYRRGAFGALIGGAVLIAIGTIPFGGSMWVQWWPLGLIALGVAMLIGQLTGW